MEVEVLQENLIKGVSRVSRFVATKSNLPILSTILIRAEKGKLRLIATDMDAGIETSVGARVNKEGEVAVPAKVLLDYVGSLPPGKLKIIKHDGSLKIESGINKAKLSSMETEDFPEIPVVSDKKRIKIKALWMEKMVRLVTFSSLSEMVRPVLSAVCLKFDGKGKMEAAATDGYRLGVLSKIEVEGLAEEGSLLVAAKVINEVEKLVKEEGVGELELMVDSKGRSVRFDIGNTFLTAKMIEGEFPDYKKIIPKSEEISFRSECGDMSDAVRLASVFARGSSNIVLWRVEEDGLIMSSNATSIGEQESKVSGTLVKGNEGKIAFNSKFLSELLVRIGEGEVEFGMNTSLQPGVFRTKEKNYVHVIMPVRVSEEK